jgi:hypothetical protein
VRTAVPLPVGGETPEKVRSTYLTYGGADRERVIDETWRLLLDRRQRGVQLEVADLERACRRICPEWRDDAMSIATALLAKAHRSVIEAVDTLALTAAEAEGYVTDVTDVLDARTVLREVEALGAAAALERRRQAESA